LAATGGHGRRRLAILVLAVVASAGCTGDGEPPSPPSPPPAAAVTPSSDAPSPEVYPATPQEYAEVTVAAWAAPDLIRLGELTTPEVHDQIVGFPGPPDLRWTFIRCEEGAGTSDCSFYNADGDQLVLTVDHALLGAPRATTAGALEGTAYPDDPEAYLAAFVAAWQAGNIARMRNLAVTAVVETFTELAATGDPEYETGATADGLVAVTVTIAGQRVETRLSQALLGDQRAIRAAA
jgi:hypothetical protein